MSQEKTSFWQSTAGTVAAVAAMVTALAGAVPVVMAIRGNDKPAGTAASPTPTATTTENPSGPSPSPGESYPGDMPGDEGSGGEPGTSVAPPVIASPKTVDFGRVAAALSAPTQGLQLVNTGQDPVTIGRVRIVGPAASSFTVSDTTCQEGAELAPDATCDLKIKFTPSGSGAQQATLIAERTPGAPIQVALSATVGLL
jgi:hypothetical protein